MSKYSYGFEKLNEIYNEFEKIMTLGDPMQVMTKDEINQMDKLLNKVLNRCSEGVIGLDKIKLYNRDENIDNLLK